MTDNITRQPQGSEGVKEQPQDVAPQITRLQERLNDLVRLIRITIPILLCTLILGNAISGWVSWGKFIILVSIYSVILPSTMAVIFTNRFSAIDRVSGAIVFTLFFSIGAGAAGAPGAAVYVTGSLLVAITLTSAWKSEGNYRNMES